VAWPNRDRRSRLDVVRFSRPRGQLLVCGYDVGRAAVQPDERVGNLRRVYSYSLALPSSLRAWVHDDPFCLITVHHRPWALRSCLNTVPPASWRTIWKRTCRG
jgi:hypothetical protein